MGDMTMFKIQAKTEHKTQQTTSKEERVICIKDRCLDLVGKWSQRVMPRRIEGFWMMVVKTQIAKN